MKTMKKILLLVVLLTILLVSTPNTVLAQSDDDDQVVFGGTYTLASGDTLDGDLVILGGNATLEEDSRVNGSVVIAGGELHVSGRVDQDIMALGGSVFLEDEALVKGDIILASASFHQAEGATIRGEIRYDVAELGNFDWDFTPPFIGPIVPVPPAQRYVSSGLSFIAGILWALLRTLAIAALAALIVLLLHKPTERVAASIMVQPAVSGGLGLLTVIVAPAFVILLMITIILIPVGLLGVLGLTIAVLFGWIAIGFEIGKRIGKSLKQSWAPAVSAGIGTFILTLVASIFGSIDCIGWMIPSLIMVVGLGGVILSRFGTQVYQPAGKATQSTDPVVIDGEVVEPEPETVEEVVEIEDQVDKA